VKKIKVTYIGTKEVKRKNKFELVLRDLINQYYIHLNHLDIVCGKLLSRICNRLNVLS